MNTTGNRVKTYILTSPQNAYKKKINGDVQTKIVEIDLANGWLWKCAELPKQKRDKLPSK